MSLCAAMGVGLFNFGVDRAYAQSAGTPAGFEIDGNQVCQSLMATNDWADNTSPMCDGVVDSDLDPSNGAQFTDCVWGSQAINSGDPTQFKTGSNKNCDLIGAGQSPWAYTSNGGGPQKNDITNVYVHTRTACTDRTTGDTNTIGCMDDSDCAGDTNKCDTWIMVGAETRSTNGDSHLDFEINQAGVFLSNPAAAACENPDACCATISGDGTVTGAGTAGGRTIDDISLDMSFVQGGSQPVLVVRKWDGDSYNSVPALIGVDVFSQTNLVNIKSGTNWQGFNSNGSVNNAALDVTALQFVEGAINQTALGLDFDPCIPDATVLVKSRSSHSNNDEDFCNAQLKDFALFPFPVEPLPECTATDDEVCAGDLSNGVCAGPVAGKGIPPFTVEWNDAASTTCTGLGFGDTCCLSFASASSGDAATYTATITDSRPCEGGDCEGTLTVNPNPDVNPTGAEECVDASDPSVDAGESGGTGTLSCAWSGAGAACLSSTTSCDPTFDLSACGVGTHEICVKATDENGCESATKCTNVIVNELPICSIPAPDPVPLCRTTGNVLCPNVSNGTSPYELSWSVVGAGWSITAGSSQTVPPDTGCITYSTGDDTIGQTSATFSLDVEDDKGCLTDCERPATCEPPPIGCLFTPDEVCVGDTLEVCLTVSGALPPFDVEIFHPDGSSLKTCDDLGDGGECCHSIVDAQLSDSGEYRATTTDSGTPAVTEECLQDFVVNPNPVADASGADECVDASDPTIHAGESGGTGVISCTWSGACEPYLSDASSCDPTFDLSDAGPGTFGCCVDLEDAEGCTDSDCTDVIVRALPTATPSGAEECIDAADPTLHANESGGTGAISCVWSGACSAYLSSTSSCDPTFDLDAAGAGTFACCVDVTDSEGCEGSGCTSVTVNDLPVCSISGPDEFCNTSTGNMYCGPAGMKTYAWSVSGGVCATSGATNGQCVSVNGAGVVAGTCTVMLTVTDNNDCEESCDKDVNVIVCNQACSPGYWKNLGSTSAPNHADEWCIAGMQPTNNFCETCGSCVDDCPDGPEPDACGAATTFKQAFAIGACSDSAVNNIGTLFEAVNVSNDKILFHCTAALLDAAHPGVADGSSVAELQGLMSLLCDNTAGNLVSPVAQCTGKGSDRATLECYCTYLIGLENIGGCPLD